MCSTYVLTAADLFQLLKETCPDAIKTGEIKNQFGRKVAIVRPGHHPASASSLTRLLQDA